MDQVRTQTLQVPGARLYYEVRGTGPVLLMIPGGPADAGAFAGIADQLADSYTVITYDPRGNSRSTLDGSPTDVHVADHADDAHRLLAAVASAPAYVLGSSSGALVGLELVSRHPEQVDTLVAHEPPLADLLADAEQIRALRRRVYQTYLSQGVAAATAVFLAGSGLDGGPGQQEQPPSGQADDLARRTRNTEFFFAHQWVPLIGYLPDLAALRATPARIVVAVGVDAVGQLAHRAGVALAEHLATTAVSFPGGHVGFTTWPVEFAGALRTVLCGG